MIMAIPLMLSFVFIFVCMHLLSKRMDVLSARLSDQFRWIQEQNRRITEIRFPDHPSADEEMK